MTETPRLCVAGHPNKGKSSIVSTLTENDSVQIGAESGTTTRVNSFEFILDGRVMLSLTDTPGFQRARQVLAWLQAEEVSPARRPERIRAFLAEPGHAERFPDEVSLLTPIMEGAGILYVVDAAQPVSSADEAEMEILCWTGQPRMAVINPMTRENCQEEWQRALSQFFQWVRVFNPMTATLPARQMLLRSMGELAPGWSRPIADLCRRLEERDRRRLQDVSEALAHYWCEQLSTRVAVSQIDQGLGLLKDGRGPASPDGEAGHLKRAVQRAEERLRRTLDEREASFFAQLLQDWGHATSALDRRINWDLDSENLMNTETWYLWGLEQKDLLVISGSAGAATGLVVDAGLGGASLMLGALSGAVLGSAGGWLASRSLSGKRLGWIPLAREKYFAGPVRHPNFPLVLIARALTFTQLLWLRPHAQRSAFALRTEAEDWSRQDQVQLLQWARQVQKGKWSPREQEALKQWIEEALVHRLEKALQREEEAGWQS